jgi:hypothetical protein
MYKLTGLNSTWNNIVHITNSGGDDHRCPGIWVRPGETNLHFHYVPSAIDSFEGVGINTEAFFTFVFNKNMIDFYINGVKKSLNIANNGAELNQILPTAIMYIGNPFHGSNSTINIQDFTLYNDVLTPSQINEIYNNSLPSARQKIADAAAKAIANAEEAKKKSEIEGAAAYVIDVSNARVNQQRSQLVMNLDQLKKQLLVDISSNNYIAVQNDKNRIQQYENILSTLPSSTLTPSTLFS